MDCILAVLSSTLLFLAAFTLKYILPKRLFFNGSVSLSVSETSLFQK